MRTTKDNRDTSCFAAIERMVFIIERATIGRAKTCGALASEYEISERTMRRDIVFLRERLNVPIEFDRCQWGYRMKGDLRPGMKVLLRAAGEAKRK